MAYKKYYLYKKQASYDQGKTWEDVTPEEYAPSGDPIGYYDTLEECMAQYRTIQSGYTCVGYDKHNQDVYEVSYDNGVTWEVVSTSAGTLIEADSPDCGYVPFSGKYKLILSNSNIVSAECDSSSAVTSGEVSTQYSGTVVSAVIGDCVTNINDNAFRKCSGLTDITISDSVTNIGNSTFMGCKKLSGLTIGNSVATIGYDAFNTCFSLSSITIPNSVLSIDYRAFNECSSLTSVTIPASVVNIGDSAFVYCRGLTSVTVLATTPPTIGYNVFMDTNDCPIYVPSGSVNAYKTANKWSTYASRIQAIP